MAEAKNITKKCGACEIDFSALRNKPEVRKSVQNFKKVPVSKEMQAEIARVKSYEAGGTKRR